MNERMDGRDWRFLIICAAIFIGGLAIGLSLFDRAFPEASIEFRYDRDSSRAIAERFLREHQVPTSGLKHTVQFTHDEEAKVFLERRLGLEKANKVFSNDVRIWYWRHRWFRPLQKEELRVDVAPTGQIVAFEHAIAEEQASPATTPASTKALGEAMLKKLGIAPSDVDLVAQSERQLPKRTETILTWESKKIRPSGAPYRYTVTVHGGKAHAFVEKLKVPDAWSREYTELRSKNEAAGAVDLVFMFVTIIAALVVFIARMRRKDIQVRLTLWSGLIGAVLLTAVVLNQFPSALAQYQTTQSYSAFVTKFIVLALLQGMAAGLFLIIVVGPGEALYRERFPGELAMSRLFRKEALGSKRVFKSIILGYTLFAGFLAYQVIFYLVASRFGAWSPADIPYSDILNTRFPWLAVAFIGFFPAVSEEFMSRAFSIPFFERIFKSTLLAIIVAGFIWGFGHAAYPNQPFYIRGIEVGVAGVIIGLLMFRFGILPLLIWHYTVDALYTSVLLFRSKNLYYILSAGVASLIFVIPLIISLILYFRNRGFTSEETILNRSIGTAPAPPPEIAVTTTAPFPSFRGLSRAFIASCILLILAGVGMMAWRVTTLDDVVNYRTTKAEAIDLARRHMQITGERAVPQKQIARAADGFRNWESEAVGEDGGRAGGYDSAAAEYLLRTLDRPVESLVTIQKDKVEAATWVVRMFTPKEKEELFVEIDPRKEAVLGMHKLLREEAPGGKLEQAAAFQIARNEFARYGLQADSFELKEALSFQQPARRDWLFHFQERQPLAPETFRRVTVRVGGDRVSQFIKTVKLPEKEIREAEKETILHAVILTGKIIGILGLLTLVITGVVIGIRKTRFEWRRALRWTAILSPLPVATALLNWNQMFFGYQTEVAWQTFAVMMGVALLMLVLFQLLLVFVALATLETLIPSALRLFSREGRSLYGAGAALAAIGAIGLQVIQARLGDALPHWFPAQVIVDGVAISDSVVTPLPLLGAIWQALLVALVMSAAIAGLASLLSGAKNRDLAIYAGTFLALLLANNDTSANERQMALMLVNSIVAATVIFVMIRFLFRDNLLAYPVAFFSWQLVKEAAGMIQNDRSDLQIQAAILLGIVVALLAWVGFSGRSGAGSEEVNVPDVGAAPTV